ncbi:hypothetical protein N1027_11020 [Herbiconiux sp. CPCC 205763]|uniref:DUF4760 domain-containing protein n=1 Tax=Herbiconiux aconitum TaxID=2970913 RepID=A0ABT2GR23_9MICO|nr:hypothetical protein [Herbiconiux aconitum]MCS5718664.1 hypothetical protein [Herbiconiux aconitum]
MEWWNAFVRWLTSPTGEFVVSDIVLPAVAIIVAGLLAAWIAHSSVKRLLAKHDRELKISAIASLIDAAEQASVWNSLTPQEQILSDRATGQADIQVRLLPIKGADVAANWAAHALAEMKRESATFGYQVEPAVFEFRDRLIEWQQRPGRAKRVFQSDLERWATEDASTERELLAQQDAWVAQQHHSQYAGTEALSAPGALSTPTASSTPAASSAPATPIAEPVSYGSGTSSYASGAATAVIAPAAPLPPTHEPRPTVQQVASGNGTRGVAPGAPSPLADLEFTVDPADARASGEIPPPVHAFPPRASE